MKYLLALICLLSSVYVQASQPPTVSKPISCVFKAYSIDTQATLNKMKVQLAHYRGYQAGGIAMMGVGALAFIAGQVMMWISVALNASGQRNYRSSYSDPLWLGGFATTIVGVGGLAGGVPVFTEGRRKAKRLKHKMADLQY